MENILDRRIAAVLDLKCSPETHGLKTSSPVLALGEGLVTFRRQGQVGRNGDIGVAFDGKYCDHSTFLALLPSYHGANRPLPLTTTVMCCAKVGLKQQD